MDSDGVGSHRSDETDILSLCDGDKRISNTNHVSSKQNSGIQAQNWQTQHDDIDNTDRETGGQNIGATTENSNPEERDAKQSQRNEIQSSELEQNDIDIFGETISSVPEDQHDDDDNKERETDSQNSAAATTEHSKPEERDEQQRQQSEMQSSESEQNDRNPFDKTVSSVPEDQHDDDDNKEKETDSQNIAAATLENSKPEERDEQHSQKSEMQSSELEQNDRNDFDTTISSILKDNNDVIDDNKEGKVDGHNIAATTEKSKPKERDAQQSQQNEMQSSELEQNDRNDLDKTISSVPDDQQDDNDNKERETNGQNFAAATTEHSKPEERDEQQSQQSEMQSSEMEQNDRNDFDKTISSNSILEDKSLHQSPESENELKEGTPKYKKQNRRLTKRKTRQKRKYINSSSDDDIPLSEYIRRRETYLPSDSGSDNYIPNSKELNSTDSEYEDNISEETKRDNEKRKRLREMCENVLKGKQKQNEIGRKDKTEHTKKEIHSDGKKKRCTAATSMEVEQTIQRAILQSKSKELQRKTAITTHEKRIDAMLQRHNLARETVAPYGDCFFDAAGRSFDISASQLRAKLCQHLEGNIESYIGFLLNEHKPNEEEDFVTDYLNEINSLKCDGYWSSTVADFLPLVLANYGSCNVRLYTSKENQPIIDFKPTIPSIDVSEPNPIIPLAYIAIPGIYEHYDACKTVTEAQSMSENVTEGQSVYDSAGLFFATPLDRTHETDERTAETSRQHEGTSTPRKSAVFITPPKRKLTRKRKSTPENWKKNIRKKLRLHGKEYQSTAGTAVKAKTILPCNCSKCKFKCNEEVTSDQRQALFESFWSLDSYERQKDYICSKVQEKKTVFRADEEGNILPKKKMVARRYTFEIEDKTVAVCKQFFMKTLAVGKNYIDHALKNKREGSFQGKDSRGKHEPGNKSDTDSIAFACQHIESFPRVAGHYTRKDSNRQFLGKELTIPRMYQLYIEKCETSSVTPLKLQMYRKIFNENYNFSFHVPKKDQCNTCAQYNTEKESGTTTSEQEKRFNLHQSRKQRAREEKANDKKTAKASEEFHAATFDLQSVLYTPCSLVSLMYYMRKLCCYNFTVYSLGNTRGSCFFWSEVDGKRGASEISTCLLRYLQSLPEKVSYVVFYSDACSGQNRNKIVSTCLLHAVTAIDHIKIIDHKFLESGHTHMEVDSMHAAIEFAKKKTQIYIPSQWDTVLKMARRKDPYTVVHLKHSNFIDFKLMTKQPIKSKKTETGSKINWTKMRWIRYKKEDADTCFFKYDLDEEHFQKIKIAPSKRISGTPTDDQVLVLPTKYESKLPISSAKKERSFKNMQDRDDSSRIPRVLQIITFEYLRC